MPNDPMHVVKHGKSYCVKGVNASGKAGKGRCFTGPGAKQKAVKMVQAINLSMIRSGKLKPKKK